MKSFSDIKGKLEKLPEFSDKHYPLAGYIAAGAITLTGLFFIYEMFATDALTFKAQWNMFKSPLGSLCYFIGLVCAIVWWGKFGHWSSTPVTETRDRFTGELIKREENYDVMEQGFAKILMPILGHFVIEPLVYGALIYYPIQCIIAVLGAIFPYVLTLIVLAIIASAWMYTRVVQIRYRSAILVFCGLLFTVAFGWGAIAMKNAAPGSTIQFALDAGNANETVEETIEATESPTDMEDDAEMQEQFEDTGEVGLMGSLPDGRTEYMGEMDGTAIEFVITKNGETGEVKALFKNSSTTIELSGESLPAMDGDINFLGSVDNVQWSFAMTGDADNISGTAVKGGEQEQKISLHRK